MPIRIDDLPPWAREQAQRQLDKRQVCPAQPSAAKYHNIPDTRTLPGGLLGFDSRKEARRFDELMQLLHGGIIRELKLQPQFTLQEAYTTPEGKRVQAIRYQADFSYERATAPDCNGEVHWIRVVEDVKSRATKTRVYEVKKKLLLERFGVEVTEV